jgi:hypothetical protein
MLSNLATNGIFAWLATAPPHLSTEFRVMRSARPVEVLIFTVLLCTVLAKQEVLHKKTTLLPEFYASLAQL